MMTETAPTLDAFAMRLIRRKAQQLIKKAGLAPYERDDVAQELSFRLLRCLRRCDPTMAHNRGYLTTLVNRQGLTWLESYFAAKNHFDTLDDVVDDGDGVLVLRGDTICSEDLAKHRMYISQSGTMRFEREHDLAAVIAKMPINLQQLCERLKLVSPAAAARDLGLTSYQMEEGLRQICRHFEAAGFDGPC